MVYSILSVAALALAVLFLLTLVALHFLEPEFEPGWRMISEYELGKYGYLMRGAFFAWGASVLLMLIVAWHFISSVGGTIGCVWFILIVIALIGAGIWKTNPITDTRPNTENTLHSICGSVVILTFPIAATLVANALLRSPFWAPYTMAVFNFTLLTWLGMIAFFASIIVARKKDPKVGENGTHIMMGWPNRLNVVLYQSWVIVLAICVIQMMK